MNESLTILDPVMRLLPYLNAEGILGTTILAVTVLAILRKQNHPWSHYLGILGIALAVAYMILDPDTAEGDWFVFDGASYFWRAALDLCVAVILLFRTNRHLRMRSSEFVILTLTILLGAHFLIIARHLFMIYLSVEVMSLSAYMLVALPLFKRQINSAFKYLVFGATSSALMLYGISLFYGIQGSLSLEGFDPAATLWQDAPGLTVLVLIIAGILFKIAAVPFHIWVSDVYSESSIPVITVFSIVPKLAAMLFLLRWVPMIPNSEYIIGILSMITLAVGNFGALRQVTIRGLLGYSAIAHTGFMLSGLLIARGNENFIQFYMIIYALMTLGAFHTLNFYELRYGVVKITDLAGTSVLSTWKTIRVVVWMIALTGLPPTAGFTAKLFLFSGLAGRITSGSNDIILYVLLFGVLNAVVSLAYYLKIPYQMIFKKPEVPFRGPKKNLTWENFLGTITVLGIIILFIKPEWLMGWINSVSFVP